MLLIVTCYTYHLEFSATQLQDVLERHGLGMPGILDFNIFQLRTTRLAKFLQYSTTSTRGTPDLAILRPDYIGTDYKGSKVAMKYL